MSKLTFITQRFNCKLKCAQCEYRKGVGGRCRNRVCKGFPICWMHNKKLYGVKTRPSVHGTGLFATENISSGAWICPYKGERITKRCLEKRYPGNLTGPYSATHKNRHFFDAACSRGIGSFANAKFNGQRSAPEGRHNAVLEWRAKHGIWLLATKDIRAGREIFCWYGDDFMLNNDHQTKRSKVVDNRPC